MTVGINNTWFEEVHQLTDGLVTDTPPELADKGAAMSLDWWDFLNRRLIRALGRLNRLVLPNSGGIILNGTFDTDLSSWTVANWVWDNGQAAINAISGFLQQGFSGTPNTPYILTIVVNSISNPSFGASTCLQVYLSSGSGANVHYMITQTPKNFLKLGVNIFTVTPTDADMNLTLLAMANTTARIDNISMVAATAVRGMHMWFKKDRTQQMFIHTNDRVYKTSDFCIFQQVASGLTATKRDFVSYAAVNPDDKLLCCDGVDVPKESNGTTYTNLTLPANVTNARFVFRIKERTVLVSVLESGTWERCRFWWGEEGTYNAWSVTNGAGFLDYVEGGGEIVTAVQYNDALVLFKSNRVGVVYWTGDINVPFRIQDFPEVPSTVFPGSVTVTPFGVLYLADDGLRLFNLASSLPIADKSYLDLTSIDISQKNAVISTWDKRRKRYLLGVPKIGDTDVTRVWVVHYGQKEDTKEARIYKRDQSVSCFGSFTRSSPLTLNQLPITLQQLPLTLDDPLILGSTGALVSGDYSGVVYDHELTSDDNGVAQVSSIELGPYPKDPETQALLDKRCKEIRLRCDNWPNSSLEVWVRPIHSQTYVLCKTLTMTDANKTQTHVIPVDMTGEQFFVNLVDRSQYGSPRPYSLALSGTHTGAPRRQ